MPDKSQRLQSWAPKSAAPARKASPQTAHNDAAIGDAQRAISDPNGASPGDVLALQRAAGNRATLRFLAKRGIQPKLTVGAADDPYEREADRVAAQVMRTANPGPANVKAAGRRVEDEEALNRASFDGAISALQRHPGDEEVLRAKANDPRGSFEAGPAFEQRLNATRGGGSPLPGSARTFMESGMGADFSGVRLHTGREAADLNRQISARAFTRGSDIYLGAGQENLSGSNGRRLLAHELTHVVQQRGGAVARNLAEFSLQRRMSDRIQRAGNPVAPPMDAAKSIHDFRLFPKFGDPAPEGWTAQDAGGQKFYSKDDKSAPSVWDLPLELSSDIGLTTHLKTVVKELQRKLIAALGGRLRAGIWKRDGIYGSATERAVKRYQEKQGMKTSGIADYATWKQLDKDAGADRGRVDYQWEEAMTEFDNNPSLRTRFDWRKKDDELNVSVPINFTGDVGQADAIRGYIKTTWNRFKISYVGNKDGKKRAPKNPNIKLNFDPGGKAAGPGDPVVPVSAVVDLFTYPHPNWAKRALATDADKKGRSDALNWRVDVSAEDLKKGIPANSQQNVKDMVSHEFGHMIGLEDEYNRSHKNLERLTGVKANFRQDKKVNQRVLGYVTDLVKRVKNAQDHAELSEVNTWILDWYQQDSTQLPLIFRRYFSKTGQKLEADLDAAAKRIAAADKAKRVGDIDTKMKDRGNDIYQKRWRKQLSRNGAAPLDLKKIMGESQTSAQKWLKPLMTQALKEAAEMEQELTAAAGQNAAWVSSQYKVGYSTGGMMGDYSKIGDKAPDSRAMSPALQHKHPLEPRHVRRFSEYVMKYKPGEIWKVAYR